MKAILPILPIALLLVGCGSDSDSNDTTGAVDSAESLRATAQEYTAADGTVYSAMTIADGDTITIDTDGDTFTLSSDGTPEMLTVKGQLTIR